MAYFLNNREARLHQLRLKHHVNIVDVYENINV